MTKNNSNWKEIEELELVINDYKNRVDELEDKLKYAEQDLENYHDALVDIYNRLKRVI